ncbi:MULTISPECIES: hypothetical protein [Acinetobacter]|uniref:Uncharacterized protein n=2 Tax=Acinetobacter TaxID=469 RepID=A0A7H2PPV4_9GAMM|nr:MULTISPECIES: hypothetical protein [Acinetobacter]MDO7360404.1 hypothetical protein [Acinetobacter geminorum]QNX04887.1 hypothetical protein IC796_16550 [Acinetobacter seifertii]QNX15363.1 hypothetical protein IC793_16040 [Acinetobacter seifertii]
MKTFIDLCLSGDVFIDEIDDYIDKWHDGEGENLELFEFLGMTADEYELWLKAPQQLATIISAKERGISLDEAMNDEVFELAARADRADQLIKIKEWLARKGK